MMSKLSDCAPGQQAVHLHSGKYAHSCPAPAEFASLKTPGHVLSSNRQPARKACYAVGLELSQVQRPQNV